MSRVNVVRLTPAEAMVVGRRMGADAARSGADPDETVAVVCSRWFWRLQSGAVQRSFAWAFELAYREPGRWAVDDLRDWAD